MPIFRRFAIKSPDTQSQVNTVEQHSDWDRKVYSDLIMNTNKSLEIQYCTISRFEPPFKNRCDAICGDVRILFSTLNVFYKTYESQVY